MTDILAGLRSAWRKFLYGPEEVAQPAIPDPMSFDNADMDRFRPAIVIPESAPAPLDDERPMSMQLAPRSTITPKLTIVVPMPKGAAVPVKPRSAPTPKTVPARPVGKVKPVAKKPRR